MGTQKSHKLRKKVRFLPPLPNMGEKIAQKLDDVLCEIRGELYIIGNAFFTCGTEVGMDTLFERVRFWLGKLVDVSIVSVCFGTYAMLIGCAIYALIDTIGGYGWITMVE